MDNRIETLIVGAGQAGLALSYCLTQLGRPHLVIERGRIAERWRSERWDSFTLLSPNWHTRLPGYHYQGPEPAGFMGRDELVRHLERYASSFKAPVRADATVTCIQSLPSGRYQVEVNRAEVIEVANVVIAIGHYHRPFIPALAANLPSDLLQFHTIRYRNPTQLPPGAVLVVGAGTSGQQIAAELHWSGRRVYLAVGHHAKLMRRYRGGDAVWWQVVTGLFDQTADSMPVAARRPSAALSGVGGGRDLDLRQLAADGLVLLGHLRGVEGTRLTFAADLEETLAIGERYEADFKRIVDDYVRRTGLDLPEEPPALAKPAPMRDIPTKLDLHAAGVTSVIWCTGFRNDLDWLKLPILDATGEPAHVRGVSPFAGLYFLGLRWLHKRKSSFIDGVGEDAKYLAQHIAQRWQNRYAG